MAATSEATRRVRLRLISEAAPPEEQDHRPTEFGLADKKQALHPGRAQPDGSIHHDFEVEAKLEPLTRTVRFAGSCVQGKPSEPFIYLGWRYVGEPAPWIRRQKIPLTEVTWKQVEQASRQSQGLLQALVPPITLRSGMVHVEWTVPNDPGS